MQRKNLWAPWRMKYIKGLTEEHECFICHHNEDTQNDRANLVLWRGRHSLVLFNRFPYNNGHMLIAPKRHIADMNEASDEELLEFTKLTRDIQNALTDTIAPHGFNVGLNFGRCAGAGLPGHMHIHVVPRWNGDTNFMAVCSDTDVISQDLFELYDLLAEISAKKGYPNL